MKNFSIIAAIGKNHELGKNGDLIFNLPNDLKFFQQTTSGHDIIMGLNTWISLPFQLKNRNHFIIALPDQTVPSKTHKTINTSTNFIEFSNASPALISDQSYVKIIRDLPTFLKNYYPKDESFIIGGASIYAQFLPYANKLYLTEVDASAPADVFFPDFNRKNYQKTILGSNHDGKLNYTHALYTKK